MWCSDISVDMPCYEVSLTEPLHDFKNTINRVFGELPFATSDKTLQRSLLEMLNEMKGRYFQFEPLDVES